MDSVRVDVLYAQPRVGGDPVLTAVLGEHRAVLVLVPVPLQSVRREGLIERSPLQFGRVGDGADRAEQQSCHQMSSPFRWDGVPYGLAVHY